MTYANPSKRSDAQKVVTQCNVTCAKLQYIDRAYIDLIPLSEESVRLIQVRNLVTDKLKASIKADAKKQNKWLAMLKEGGHKSIDTYS